MNYEEKYKEALERAKQFHKKELFAECNGRLVEYIFPELKESEDEMIRKALLRFHKSTIDIDGIKGEDILSWLKSLRPQNRWKPSDEQIAVIEAVINNRSFQRRHLDSLYADLKKLKE